MAADHHESELAYLEHAVHSRRPHRIASRSGATSCYEELPGHQIIISRTAFIATIAICSVITFASLVVLSIVLTKKCRRRKELRAAKGWGRQSLFLQKDRRFSYATKGVDDSYTQQYRGVLGTVVENPEMGSDEPLEMGMGRRASLWEVDGSEKETLRLKIIDTDGMEHIDMESGMMTRQLEVVDGKVREKNAGGKRKFDDAKRTSLFWFEGAGVWMPKR